MKTMKEMKRMNTKQILRNALVFICLCGIFILPASANVYDPYQNWNMPSTGINNSTGFQDINSPSGIWNQENLNPFGVELRARPGEGTGQKEEPYAIIPVSGGIWIIAGLSIAYGIFCKKRRKRIM